MFQRLGERLRALGPGLLLAAAGIGAGDVVVASVTGIRFGTTLLWAVAFTAALKFVLTEALARWQLATGETLVRAWVNRLPRWVSRVFAAYLLFWTFMVGASLASACGLAGASLLPIWSPPIWGAIHSGAAAVLVAANRYAQFQQVMKVLIGVMALSVLACAFVSAPSWGEVGRGLLVPVLPEAGGEAQVLALLGGIGGSLTLICYGYWMRAAAWRSADKLALVRADVRLAYVFTGLFGIALVVIAAGVEAHGAGGLRIALEIAERLERVGGTWAHRVFLLGFWCTVFTAMLGVWQGVPQIYVDLIGAWRGPAVIDGGGVTTPRENEHRQQMRGGGTPPPGNPWWTERRIYLAALGFLAGPPLVLLWHREPVGVVVAFSITGAFVMPFLAGTLLYLNNRRDWMGTLANRWPGNVALAVCLLVFGAVCASELGKVLR